MTHYALCRVEYDSDGNRTLTMTQHGFSDEVYDELADIFIDAVKEEEADAHARASDRG